jgi:hypothetical protein
MIGRAGRDPTFAARLRDEALFGRLPLVRGEREYSTKGILATGFTYAVAAWCFLIGGYAANVVGAAQGVVALIAGCVMGVTLSAAASALACNRYGLEQIDYTKSALGRTPSDPRLRRQPGGVDRDDPGDVRPRREASPAPWSAVGECGE